MASPEFIALEDVTRGDFARRWVADYANDRAWLKAARAKAGEHPLEDAGKELRALLKGSK